MKYSNFKHNIYECSLVLKSLCFVSKGSLNIPEYLLTGLVQYLYTIEHAVKNIANHRFQLISVYSLIYGSKPRQGEEKRTEMITVGMLLQPLEQIFFGNKFLLLHVV